MDSKKQQLGVLTLAGFALLSAGGPLGTDMYLPALPLIGRDLGASPPWYSSPLPPTWWAWPWDSC